MGTREKIGLVISVLAIILSVTGIIVQGTMESLLTSAPVIMIALLSCYFALSSPARGAENSETASE